MSEDQLPIPDYDHVAEGALEQRIRSLAAGELEQLDDYERSHADRPHVRQILAARLEQLRAGAEPSKGGQSPPAQTQGGPEPETGSSAGPATAAEPGQPLRHGVAEQTPNRRLR